MTLMNNNLSELSVTAYDYELPEELIASYPLATRSASRLMHINSEGSIIDKKFTELSSLLNSGDLIIFNDTKVMKARLFGQKDTGGQVEILVEKITDDNQFTQGNSNVALCHVRASKSPKIGQKLFLADNNISCEMIGRHENLFILVFDKPILNDLEQHGELPIPPYFNRRADETDNTRYQTIFNNPEKIASVAAPTASLHFDDFTLEQLSAKGVKTAFVTLNVGAGTFAPVKTDNILEHTMHSEYAHLPESTANAINETHASGGKVIAVGTTVTRVLESAYLHTVLNSQEETKQQKDKGSKGLLSAWAGDTDIFIYPGYEFKVIDRLITNFHLPKSTLLMLISAFVGKDTVMTAYQHAINEKYRFFSYGDSMILELPSQNTTK